LLQHCAKTTTKLPSNERGYKMLLLPCCNVLFRFWPTTTTHNSHKQTDSQTDSWTVRQTHDISIN